MEIIKHGVPRQKDLQFINGVFVSRFVLDFES